MSTCRDLYQLLLTVAILGLGEAFSIHATIGLKFTVITPTIADTRRSALSTSLQMGILDSISDFLQSREGDFVKLEETETFGPGPVLILYKVPPGIDDAEVLDMIADGAPLASRKGVKLARITNDNNELLSCTVEVALNTVIAGQMKVENKIVESQQDGYPVLYFSGFDNREMMAVYNIVGSEIYQENSATAACARAVPNAMVKSLGQVLEEISGDHRNAQEMQGEDGN